MGSSLNGAMVSRVMYRARWTAHSSFCSSRMAPTRRVIASSLGKMPTTSVRRLISPLTRSSGLVAAVSGGRIAPSPGGVLIGDQAGSILGAIGISGDKGEHDETAVVGVQSIGLRA